MVNPSATPCVKDGNTSLGLDSSPAKAGSEKAAWERLALIGAIPPDAGYSPTKAKDGAYSRQLKAELAKPAKATVKKAKGSASEWGRLKPHQILEKLPERIGRLRLNIRSRDVHTETGILDVNDAQHLYLKLSNIAETWSKDVTADAVALLSGENSFDPVADFLNDAGSELSLEQWQRLDKHLLGTDDPIAAEFLPRYLISAVARVFDPGCDVRQTPVLVGPQWRGKTALGRILFGAEQWISGIGDLGKDAQMKCHTAWGIELAELDGVTRRSDQESLKAFLTETCDSIRRPYDKGFVRHPRRFVFWGTSNGAALRDATGNTRYVTIPIPDRMLPLEWAQRNRNALWARAVQQYRAGVDWNQCSETIRNSIAERNDNFTELDPWHERIAQVLARKALELQTPVKVEELLKWVGMPVERQKGVDGQRVRRIAESLGWVMERRRVGIERKRGLWPQGPQDGPQDVPQDEASDTNASDSVAIRAIRSTKELGEIGKREKNNGIETQVAGSFAPKLVALVATPPNASHTNGSERPQDVASLVARDAKLVARVSPQTIPGFICPSTNEVGSGADVEAGEDPFWGPRP